MSTPPPDTPGPELRTGDATFDAYAEAMGSDGAPLLGHLVLYSVFDGQVTRDDLASWFAELDLDESLLPPPLRHTDAYERVTGPNGVKVSYPLDDPSAVGPASKYGRRRGRNEYVTTVTLMVRPVRRDGGQIVRHVVREVRDEERSNLEYDTRIAICTFDRDNSEGSAEGAGTLTVEENRSAIARLPEAEQATVRQMLAEVADSFRHRCTYLTSDRLRSVVRQYVENLNAIRVRSTGGVYFVHRQHAEVLGALRELVGRFGQGSHLVRVPLPDQEEMREMIITAFTTKAKDELDDLARDIAAAQRNGKAAEAQKLYQRFTTLQAATNEHSDLLSTSLDDTKAALQLVKIQLGGLLATATEEE
ncbi:DUF6744 family protein [Streptomyces sp. NPDC057638]|uniref:DUF6744 family protein n=1 Tax=Streptomyces sp. NPDC057638 TaxID=3346190 RepID=UPI0036C4B389